MSVASAESYDENDPESMKREIARLNEKIQAMRTVLWEWNVSSGAVWEYHKLRKVGECANDYRFIDDAYEPDMPLYGDDNYDLIL